MSQELDPRIKHFQEIKAQEKAQALKHKALKDQIRALLPGKSEQVVNQVLQAHLKAQTPEIIHIKNQQGKFKPVQVFRV